VRIRGFIDRVSRARDGAIEIHDYKTSARVPSQQAVDADRQLTLYEMGWRERHGEDRPVRLVWHFVRRGVIRTSERSRAQRDALRDEVLSRVARIREEHTWAPRPGPLCRWCEYRDGCAASPLRRRDVPAYEDRPSLRAAGAALEARSHEQGPVSAVSATPAAPQLALPLG
jgi:RecB family exonuclease